ncbi:hypothetical protein SmJEL517_g05011 [Synchytrium microbalum]|uniref:C2H2-type domain-containing protein n=1 Tax=Synchytrium microbalum TaxID=1806994 RepID=A0A507BNS2_9FUNG|nr:uncharacterized protein SmJEL517_g05011 [Synchytrium microbalum]TPX31710.1 hypothetical protein SmJEL517_g05011 [Synchytrium microbalum]
MSSLYWDTIIKPDHDSESLPHNTSLPALSVIQQIFSSNNTHEQQQQHHHQHQHEQQQHEQQPLFNYSLDQLLQVSASEPVLNSPSLNMRAASPVPHEHHQQQQNVLLPPPTTDRPRTLSRPNTLPSMLPSIVRTEHDSRARTLTRNGSSPNIILTPSPPDTTDTDSLAELQQPTVLYTPAPLLVVPQQHTDSLLARPSPLDDMLERFANPQLFDSNAAFEGNNPNDNARYNNSNSFDAYDAYGQFSNMDGFLSNDGGSQSGSGGVLYGTGGSRSPSPAPSEDSEWNSDAGSDYAYDAVHSPFGTPASPSGSLKSLPIPPATSDFLDPSSAGDARSRRWSAGSIGTPRRRSRSISSVRSNSSSKSSKEPLVCPKCEKQFPRKFNLTSHMVSHTSDRPYPCQYCEKAFKRRPDLYRHERMVHVPFGCDKCKSRFATEDALRDHACPDVLAGTPEPPSSSLSPCEHPIEFNHNNNSSSDSNQNHRSSTDDNRDRSRNGYPNGFLTPEITPTPDSSLTLLDRLGQPEMMSQSMYGVGFGGSVLSYSMPTLTDNFFLSDDGNIMGNTGAAQSQFQFQQQQ